MAPRSHRHVHAMPCKHVQLPSAMRLRGMEPRFGKFIPRFRSGILAAHLNHFCVPHLWTAYGKAIHREQKCITLESTMLVISLITSP